MRCFEAWPLLRETGCALGKAYKVVHLKGGVALTHSDHRRNQVKSWYVSGYATDVRPGQRAWQNARRTFVLHTKQRTLQNDSRATRQQRVCHEAEDRHTALRTRRTRPYQYE
jgi:hypothetical protein